MMMPSLIIYFVATLVFANSALAAEQIYVREYTYQASDADSKLTARTVALQEVKRELLNELGTHVSSLVKQQTSSDGTHLGTAEIETLSAGVTSVEILDEKWNGVVYMLKAQIKADPADVLKSLHKMLDADKKQKRISELSGDISKIQSEKIQIAASLTESKKETTAALIEIARLRKQLEKQQTGDSQRSLQVAYQRQVNQLTLNEWFLLALKYDSAGDYQLALQWYQKAAEQGFAPAQYNLGLVYLNGEGVTRDTVQAVDWFQKAAEQGHVKAQHNLGVIYISYTGLRPDEKSAMYWFFKAAEQGLPNSQYNLGVMYANGEGAPQDDKKAVHWYLKAAKQGFIDAQYNLGVRYAIGNGIPRDTEQSVYWYQKAADQGHAEAQFNLGVMFYKGEGVVRDEKRAVDLWKKAAAQGDTKALNALQFAKKN